MARRSISRSIAATISWLRMYSNRMSGSAALPPPPIPVMAPRSPAAAAPGSSERIEKETSEWYSSSARK